MFNNTCDAKAVLVKYILGAHRLAGYMIIASGVRVTWMPERSNPGPCLAAGSNYYATTTKPCPLLGALLGAVKVSIV